MRPLLTGLFVLVVATFVIAQDKIEPQKKLTLYPLVKGSKWEYEITADGNNQSAEVVVTKITKEKGKRDLYTLTTKIGEGEVTEETSADDKGVYRHSFHGQGLKTPLPIIKYPYKAGATWTEKVSFDGSEVDVTCEAMKQAPVKVPAGKFKAYPIKTEFVLGGQKMTLTTWFVDGVGMVKQELNSEGKAVLIELKKFAPAKKDD